MTERTRVWWCGARFERKRVRQYCRGRRGTCE